MNAPDRFFLPDVQSAGDSRRLAIQNKWVTERAYDNPKFVEDLVRDIALRLMAEPRIAARRAISENFESIHKHSAYAELHGANA